MDARIQDEGHKGLAGRKHPTAAHFLPLILPRNSLLLLQIDIVQEQARQTTLTKTTPHEHSLLTTLSYLENIHSALARNGGRRKGHRG